MKLTSDSLNYAKTLYGSWGALSRAGFGAEIMNAFANHQIQLTQHDRDEICRVFWIYSYDSNGWDLLLQRFK